MTDSVSHLQVIPVADMDAFEIASILDVQLYNSPFGRWDSRVDVFIDTHLTEKAKAEIEDYLARDHECTIKFSERPGVSPQTWIVINRPDPTEWAFLDLITNVVEQTHGRNMDKSDIDLVIEMSIPARVEQRFKEAVTNLFHATEVIVTRERFMKHQTKVTIKRS